MEGFKESELKVRQQDGRLILEANEFVVALDVKQAQNLLECITTWLNGDSTLWGPSK